MGVDLAEDKELLDALVAEVEEINKELKAITAALTKTVDIPGEYARFGQIIDRIYGTAATMGYDDFAAYTRTVKDVCYICERSSNTYARSKVLSMMKSCVVRMEALCKVVYEPEKEKKYRYILAKESDEIKEMARVAFRNLSKKPQR